MFLKIGFPFWNLRHPNVYLTRKRWPDPPKHLGMDGWMSSGRDGKPRPPWIFLGGFNQLELFIRQSWGDWNLKCLKWWTKTILSWLHGRRPLNPQINDWYGRCAKEGSRNCVTFLDPLIQLQVHESQAHVLKAACQSWWSTQKWWFSSWETPCGKGAPFQCPPINLCCLLIVFILQQNLKEILRICLN